MKPNLWPCVFKALKSLSFCVSCVIFVMHSFSYGFLFCSKNWLLWFTNCMPGLFLKELRYNCSAVKIPFPFGGLLTSELQVFVWRYIVSSLWPVRLRKSRIRVLEIICLCREHFPTKPVCLGFALIIMTSKKWAITPRDGKRKDTSFPVVTTY